MKYETAKRKADELLKLGDALGNSAEGRRLLRKCRYYRRIARAAKPTGK